MALSELNCSKINVDPRRSKLRVPVPSDCSVDIPSPNGRLLISTNPVRDEDEHVTLRATGGLVVRGLQQPMTILWNPKSTGFLINDGEGSGQVSRLRYFHWNGRRWQESRALDRSGTALYKRRYDCRARRDSYTNVSGLAWTAGGLLRTIVQEGVHSAGCIQPYEDRNVLFEVIGDPMTGRIVSSREVRTLR